MKNLNREEAVFASVVGCPAQERPIYLDQACGGDLELRKRIEALLRAYEQAEGFLEESADPEARSRALARELGS